MADKRRRPSPAADRRAILWARVSSMEQQAEGYSLPAQVRLLREYAARHGLEVVAERTVSESASEASRRLSFRGLLAELAKPGAPRNLLAERTDRITRSFTDMVALEELRTGGLQVHLVRRGQVFGPEASAADMDTWEIEAWQARRYLRVLSEEVKKGMREKARRGTYPTMAPLGYLNALEGKRRVIVVDPIRGPMVRRAFELCAAGVSIRKIADRLRADGLRSPKGRLVSVSQIHHLLGRPIYRGDVAWNGEVIQGDHEALVTRRLWQEAQDALTGRRSATTKAQADRPGHALAGVLHCACGRLLVGDGPKKGGLVYYRCEGCRGKVKALREDRAWDAIRAEMSRLPLPADVRRGLRAHLLASADSQRSHQADALAVVTAELRRLRDYLETAYTDRLGGRLTPGEYDRLVPEWRSEQERLLVREAGLEAAAAAVRDDGIRLVELASRIPKWLDGAIPSARRKVLQGIFASATWDGETLSLEFAEPFDLLALPKRKVGSGDGGSGGSLEPKQAAKNDGVTTDPRITVPPGWPDATKLERWIASQPDAARSAREALERFLPVAS